MSKGLIDLISILDLEQLEVNLFRGNSPKTSWQRVFGGQVIGQALVAATRTVDGRHPHSLHCYFMLPGDPKVPIIYEVDRLRDGRSFTTRRVLAIQHGQAIFSMSASFHLEEEGFAHQAEMPKVPGPDELPSEEEVKGGLILKMPEPMRTYYERERPLEIRPVELNRYMSREPGEPRFHVWIKTTGRLPDDPAIHQCVLAYASDMTLLDTSLIPHGRTVFEPEIQPASLDHAMWFHRPFRADEWLLYAQDTPSAGGARGLSRGLIFKQDGTLVASVAQEGLIRERRA
jgi:acyl-CoA thioesterase II